VGLVTGSVRPLDGITVVTLEHAVSAPFASRQLADLGARVIKVERPGGGDFARGYDTLVKGLASYFVWLNRSKESLTLDLKHPAGAQVLDRLLERADVFLHNLAPGAVGRLGFGAEVVRHRYPRLISCAISGYGSVGPYRDRRAYDLLIQADLGLMSLTGTPDTPSRAGIPAADIAAGMYGYSGVLAALLARAKTGSGSWLEVPMADALAEWLSYAAYYTDYGGVAPPRTGASHSTVAPYGPFATSDGTIYLSVQNDREWARFCGEVIGQPELARDPRFDSNPKRAARRAELQAIIEAGLAGYGTDQVAALLDQAKLAWSRLNPIDQLRRHPQLAARNRWREIGSPAGPLWALLPPVAMEGVEPVMGAIPAVGEHTDAILAELGFERGLIDQWREQQVI
jgi:itaconate CoA-transferase